MTWPMMRRIPTQATSWLVAQLQQHAWIILPQTLLTLATILLSTLSFVLLIAAGSSCHFVVSTSTAGGGLTVTESSAREEGYIDDGFVITTYEEQQYYYASFGIFCEDDDTNNNSDSDEISALIVIVRLFYLLSLILTFSLVIMTILWIMQLSTSTSYSCCCNYNNEEDKVWKRMAHLAITSIICHIPVLLLLLDSRHCTDDDDDDDDGGRCALGNGSLPYFLSMFALTALLLLVKLNTMPDWKEEYELYKLVRQRDVEIEQLDDDMTIEKKDGHNFIEDPKNSTMMSDDDYYDNDCDDNDNRENMDEERVKVNCLMNVRIHSITERRRRRRCPTKPPPLVIQCPVSEDEDNNSSMIMTMMMPTNDISKSPRRYKGIEEQEQQQQQRTSSSPTSVIVDNIDCEFQSPPLPTPVCSVMVVNDEELGHHHPSFNNTYLQLSFSTINNNNNNQVQIMSSDDEVMHNNIPQSNDYNDSENVSPENDNQYSSSCNDSKGSNTTYDNIGVNRSSTELIPTRKINIAKDPELDMYPSDSSVSELSLDSEDEQQGQQSKPHSCQGACNDNKTKIATTSDCSIYISDSSADDGEFTSDDNSESEMYAIIAGVRKLNRRMSGKTAPQYKRRRRRKGTSEDVSTVKSFTSHGSLLDKIIPEELTEGDVPSPPRLTISTKTKKKREDHHHHHQHHHDGEVDDCYPSLNNSDEVSTYEELQSLQPSSPEKEIESKKYDHNSEYDDIHQLLEKSGDISFGSSSGYGGDVVSDSDESMSLRASQARKHRIVSAHRVSLLPHNSDTDEYDDDFRGITNSPPSLAVTGLVTCENQLNDASKDSNIDRNSNHINSAWQARQVRMARLRMSRGEQEKPSPTLEPEGKIIRSIDSVVACYSDENSI
jgi:hypothetical protein